MREKMLGNTTTIIKKIESDSPQGFDIDVQSAVPTRSELIVLLLTIVEQVTGVPADSYIDEIGRYTTSEE
jgi:hypothetical protein